MAVFYTDFSEYTTGQAPSDWAERWATGNSTWSISASGNNKYLTETQTVNDDRILSWNDIGSVADIDVLVKVRTSSATGYQNHIHVRGSGTGTNKNSYYVALHESGGTKALTLEQWHNHQWLSVEGIVYNWSPNTWYWIRFRARNNVLQAGIWPDGVPEPATWDIEYTDTTGTSNTSPGWVGLGNYQSSGTRDVDVFSIGTGVDAAPEIAPFTEKPFTEGIARTVTAGDIEWLTSNNKYEGRTAEITTIGIHWWDDPDQGPTLQGVLNWLRSPASEISAHFVVVGTRIIQLVDIDDTSWHAGQANPYTIGIEISPFLPAGTYETVAGLVLYLESLLSKDLPMVGHKDLPGNATLCPGDVSVQYLTSLAEPLTVSSNQAKVWTGSAWGSRYIKTWNGTGWD